MAPRWATLCAGFCSPLCPVLQSPPSRSPGYSMSSATIPGVKEDVTEIVLNVKGIIAKLYSEGTKTVYIEASGEGEVTAGDIKADSEVEILNPEHAHCHPGAGRRAEHGADPVPWPRLCARRAQQDRPRPSSASSRWTRFTHRCKRSTTPWRTPAWSDLTDFDKLTLEVWTDGTIAARDAVSLGARILCDHFMPLHRPQRDHGQQVHGGGEGRRPSGTRCWR